MREIGAIGCIALLCCWELTEAITYNLIGHEELLHQQDNWNIQTKNLPENLLLRVKRNLKSDYPSETYQRNPDNNELFIPQLIAESQTNNLENANSPDSTLSIHFITKNFGPNSPFFIGTRNLFFPLPLIFLPFGNNFPAQPQPKSPGNNKPVTLGDRGGFDDDMFNKYYNSETGITLDVVKPMRPPTFVIPPSDHSDPKDAPPSQSAGASSNSQAVARPPSIPTTNRPYYPQAKAYNISPKDTCEDIIVKCCSLPTTKDQKRCLKDTYSEECFLFGDVCMDMGG